MNQPAAARAASDASVAAAINRNYLGDEEQIVRELADAARMQPAAREKIAARAAQLVEGVRTTRAAVALAHTHGVEMPITAEVHHILFAGKDPRRALRDLMLRAPKPETWSAARGVV